MYLFSPSGFTDVVQGPNVIHEAPSTIAAFKERIELVKEEEVKLRQKIKKLSFKSNQLSLLIDKTLQEREEKPIVLGPLKPVIPPLTNVENAADKTLQKLLLQSDTTKILNYLNENPIFEQLIFSQKSIFDDKLQIALTHATPEVQILFLNKMTERFKIIKNYFTDTLKFITELAYEKELIDILTTPNISETEFMKFYFSQLNKISERLNFDSFKVVYTCSEGETLFYPDLNQSRFIDIDDSLSGQLIHNDCYDFINDPTSSKSFEITCEAPIFNTTSVHCLPLHLNQMHVALCLLFSNRRVNSIEKEFILATMNLMKPLISLWRFAFLHASPFSYTKLAKSISNLREHENSENDLFSNVSKEACYLCNAKVCRVLAVEGAEVDFPSLPILPAEPSLIRESYENNVVNAIRNPRTQSLFNKKCDDEITLPKITSLLVVPVKTLPVILAIYNPLFSNEFSNITVGMARLFAESLSPLLLQYKLRRQLNVAKKEQQRELGSFPFSSDFLLKFTKEIGKSDFIENVSKFLKMEINIYLKLDDDYYENMITKEKTDKENLTLENEEEDSENLKIFHVVSHDKMIYLKATYIPHEDEERFDNHINCLETFALMLSVYLQSKENEKVINIIDSLSNPSDENMSELLECKIVSDKKSMRSASVTASVCDDGTPIYVASDKKLDDKEFELLESYAEWQAFAKSHEKEMERNDVLVATFIRNKATDVFDCDVHMLSDFLTTVAISHSEGSFALTRIYEIVNSLLINPTWKEMFNDTEKVIIGLLAVTYGCMEQWTKIDSKSYQKEIQKLPVYCHKFACRIVDKLCGNLEENDVLQILETIKDYSLNKTASEECMIIAKLKLYSLDNYKPSVLGKTAIGKAIIYVSQSVLVSLDPQASVEEINTKYNEESLKQILFSAEKILIPMLTYLSSKNTAILKMLSNVRESMKLLRSK